MSNLGVFLIFLSMLSVVVFVCSLSPWLGLAVVMGFLGWVFAVIGEINESNSQTKRQPNTNHPQAERKTHYIPEC